MKLEKYDVLIQKFLGDELSEPERRDFERELKSNIDLRNELKLYQNVESAVKDDTLEVFKQKLKDIHDEIPGNQRINKVFRSDNIGLLAASIVIVLTVSGILFFTFYNSNSSTKVFKDYYQPYEMTLTTRNVETDLNPDLIKATNYYTNLDYKNAKSILEKLKSMEGNNNQVLIMLGVSNMELNNLEEAMDNFIAVISDNNPLYSQQADWYLALTYLKAKDKENAFLQLKAIISEDGFYKEKAIELIMDLNK